MSLNRNDEVQIYICEPARQIRGDLIGSAELVIGGLIVDVTSHGRLIPRREKIPIWTAYFESGRLSAIRNFNSQIDQKS
jgi:hypothetical protein